MIVVTGIPAASQRALLDELTALGTNMLRAGPAPDQDPPVSLPADAVARVERIGPVTGAAAVANTHRTVRRSDRVPPTEGSGLSVLAATTDLLGQLNGSVRDGRFLDTSTSRFPTVVLGYVAAGRLGVDRLVPGRQAPQVYIGETWFTVIGILAPMPLAPDVERSVLVGWDAARRWLGFDGRPTVVYAKAREDAIDDVRAVLAPTLYPQLPGLVQVSRPSDALAAKRATESNFSALLLGLAGVALLVGGHRRGEHDVHLGAGTAPGDRPAAGTRRDPRAHPGAVPDRGGGAVGAGRPRRHGARAGGDDGLLGLPGVAGGVPGARGARWRRGRGRGRHGGRAASVDPRGPADTDGGAGGGVTRYDSWWLPGYPGLCTLPA